MKSFLLSVVEIFRKYRVLYIIIGLSCALVITYTVAGVLAARKKIKELNAIYMPEQPYMGNELPQIFEIRKQNTFDLTRLSLSKSDSVSLLIDFVDSLVTLDLKGVAVHKAKMVHFSKSALFDGLHPDALLNLMSSPMQVSSQYSSIVKDPRIVVKAPKDTIEAAAQAIAVDTLAALQPSFYFLGLNNGIQISFVHEYDKGHSYFPLVLNQKIKQFYQTTDSLRRFRLPDYVPTIQIELAKTDATTIFKAIPHHAYIAVRF